MRFRLFSNEIKFICFNYFLVDILKVGGNVVDVVVVMVVILNVIEFCLIGIGGDVFCLFYDVKRRKVESVNGRYMLIFFIIMIYVICYRYLVLVIL